MSLENAIWQKADCLYTLPFTDTVLLQLVDIVLGDRENLLRFMLNSQLALYDTTGMQQAKPQRQESSFISKQVERPRLPRWESKQFLPMP